MNNLLSYCGLVDAKIRGSEKDLPVGSKECNLLSIKELFLTTITEPPEVIVNKFFLLPCSKGQVVRAYLDTIQMTLLLSGRVIWEL
jgi:hypothetical protein